MLAVVCIHLSFCIYLFLSLSIYTHLLLRERSEFGGLVSRGEEAVSESDHVGGAEQDDRAMGAMVAEAICKSNLS